MGTGRESARLSQCSVVVPDPRVIVHAGTVWLCVKPRNNAATHEVSASRSRSDMRSARNLGRCIAVGTSASLTEDKSATAISRESPGRCRESRGAAQAGNISTEDTTVLL